jgi:integrase
MMESFMKKAYEKMPNLPGIYKNLKSGSYLARKKINGKEYSESFKNLRQARQWRHSFGGFNSGDPVKVKSTSLNKVWLTMQREHFPTLATSTKAIWHRRYEPWKSIEHLPMDKITPSLVTKWVYELVEYYKSDFYQSSGRGKAGRCNLNNELNMFVTIFNWYKESEEFEKEALHLTNPIRKKHKKLGFIKPVPEKKMQISLDDALTFFEHLRPLYRSVAMMQFFTAGRISEVAGMQWSNVDLENKRLIIRETVTWDPSHKTFLELKPFPKNKEARVCYLSEEMLQILKERKAFQLPANNYVFHVEGKPLNYCTIQIHYRAAQRKGKLPYSGTHILRHGMAKLARKVGGLDAVLAMTGHKDIKLADHYSKCTEDDQKEVSMRIFEKIREASAESGTTEELAENVFKLSDYASKA